MDQIDLAIADDLYYMPDTADIIFAFHLERNHFVACVGKYLFLKNRMAGNIQQLPPPCLSKGLPHWPFFFPDR
jgi:hypothetical protein